MGTTDFSLEALKVLHENELNIVCVYTKTPKPKGRGAKLEKTVVHEYAIEHGLTVETPKTLRTEGAFAVLKSYAPDIIVVAAYGLILPREVLELPKHGCINIHGSYLPRWRGAAPIERALLAGDKTTGITIMQMDEGVDTGDIISKEKIAIGSDEDFTSLFNRLKVLGAAMILDVVRNIDHIKRVKQPEVGATYAHKIESQEYILNPQDSMEVNYNKVRALKKGCKFFYHKDEFYIVHKVDYISSEDRETLYLPCKDGYLEILKIQKPGKKVMDVKEFLRGLQA